MIEFTLVLPLLLLLAFGITEFGRAINYWIDETHLAATGARWAAVNTGNTADNPLPPCPAYSDGTPAPAPTNLAQAVQCRADTNELRSGGTDSVPATPGSRVCISFPNGVTRPTGFVRVVVTSTFHWLPIVDIAGFGSTTLEGSADMRLEGTWTGPNPGGDGICSS